MPLKHHIETAYILVLALVTCVAAFVASVLPHLPAGLGVWSVALTLAVLYPLSLGHTLKENRADYEFRVLHWFPALILVLWLLFETVGSMLFPLHILQLGLFFLWSMPLAILGIVLLMIFSAHVLRRSKERIAALAVIGCLFLGGAAYTEANGLTESLQTSVASGVANVSTLIAARIAQLNGIASAMLGTGTVADAGVTSSKSSSSASSSRAVIAVASSSMAPDFLQMEPDVKPAIAAIKPTGLASSGPDIPAFLFLMLLSLYTLTLHVRATKRI